VNTVIKVVKPFEAEEENKPVPKINFCKFDTVPGILFFARIGYLSKIKVFGLKRVVRMSLQLARKKQSLRIPQTVYGIKSPEVLQCSVYENNYKEAVVRNTIYDT
jgi:hypothetical protein